MHQLAKRHPYYRHPPRQPWRTAVHAEAYCYAFKLSSEDAIADLAMVFHWTPADSYPLALSELMNWREQARKRTEQEG